MTEETFGLTQVNEHSKLILPALTTPHTMSRRMDTSARLSSDRSSRSLNKSTSVLIKVRDQLTQVQEDVKSSFDLLYTSRRGRLLPKAMELERSESTKEQLQGLETHVVSLLKTYNELQSRRKTKEQQLNFYKTELEILLSKEADVGPAQTQATEVEKRLTAALRQLDHECDYTETLDHMITESSKDLKRKMQPIYHLRKELEQMKIRYHESEADFLRISMESKSVRNTARKRAELLSQQRTLHGSKVQDKIMEFRRRAELIEFLHRQEGQKDLESRIRENEAETRRMEDAQKQVETAEQMIESSKGHIEALHEYERQTERLSRAAHTGNIQQVVEYWQYLQDFGGSLQGKVEAGNQRVAEMREEVERLKQERTELKLLQGTEDDISPAQFNKLRLLLQTKEEQVEQMVKKLDVWQQAVASMRGRIESLYLSTGGLPAELTIDDLVCRTAQQIEALIAQE